MFGDGLLSLFSAMVIKKIITENLFVDNMTLVFGMATTTLKSLNCTSL